MAFVPADPDFEARTRASFAKQGAMKLLGAVLERGGRHTHCATGTQTLMTLLGRTGVKD